jgi:hypothetical protein
VIGLRTYIGDKVGEIMYTCRKGTTYLRMYVDFNVRAPSRQAIQHLLYSVELRLYLESVILKSAIKF